MIDGSKKRIKVELVLHRKRLHVTTLQCLYIII